jgi:hypothetical protein
MFGTTPPNASAEITLAVFSDGLILNADHPLVPENRRMAIQSYMGSILRLINLQSMVPPPLH